MAALRWLSNNRVLRLVPCAIAFMLCGSSEVVAQSTCELARNRFFGEICSSMSRIVWESPDNNEVELTLLSSEQDRVSCGHLRGLRRQATSVLSFVDSAGGGNEVSSTEEFISLGEFHIAAIKMFQDYELPRFFRRAQLLEISIAHPIGSAIHNERLVVLFNGEIVEYAAVTLRSGVRDGRLTFSVLTNSAELCFENSVFVVIYQDILHKNNLLLYRRPLVSRALSIPFERLEGLENRTRLYRDRATDNDG